jgi:AAA domain
MGAIVLGAANQRLFGRIDFRPNLRSIYADYEQTRRVTHERFQLLCGGYQISIAGLGERFGYRWRPVPTWAPARADHQKTLDDLSWHTEDVDLLVVDSLRACAFDVEENSNAASAPLDLATEVSEKTGVTVVFIDHASGKAGENQKRVDAQRGHSSKKDACQTLLVLSTSKGQPTLVTCERAQVTAEAEWPGDFSFSLARGAGGLRLEEVQEAQALSQDVLLATLGDAFVKVLRDGNEGATTDEVRALLGVRRQDLVAARDRLERSGVIVDRGKCGKPSWYLAGRPEDTPF